MKVKRRVEIEGVGLHRRQHAVKTGKAETHQKVDAKGSKDGFSSRLILHENTPKDDDHNEYVERKTENDARDRKDASVRAGEDDTLDQSRNRKYQSKQDMAAPETNSVNAKHRDDAAENAHGQVRKALLLSVRIEDEEGQLKQEQHGELALRHGLSGHDSEHFSEYRRCLI